jgi:hypothetical protein
MRQSRFQQDQNQSRQRHFQSGRWKSTEGPEFISRPQPFPRRYTGLPPAGE